MPSKPLIIALLLLAASTSLVKPCYCVAGGDCGVKPPADWEHNISVNADGTPLTITDVLPDQRKENALSGTYSNMFLYAAQDADGVGNRYHVKIWLEGALSNGSSTIPVSSLKYMLTYVYMYHGNSNDGPGQGTAPNYQKYVEFTPAEAEVYYSTAAEAPTFPTSAVQGQFQFKYAVQLPSNQSAGTYTGATIKYKIITDDSVSVTRSCPLSITVGKIFTLSVDRGSIDFEKMSPGETKDNIPVEGVIVASKTNVGTPWFLKIANDSPLSNGPYIIPNTNFIWYGWSDGKGRWFGSGTDQLSLTPMLVYSSGAGEGNTLPDGTLNHLKFKLTIPRGQSGGKYLSSVRLTMTE